MQGLESGVDFVISCELADNTGVLGDKAEFPLLAVVRGVALVLLALRKLLLPKSVDISHQPPGG